MRLQKYTPFAFERNMMSHVEEDDDDGAVGSS